MKRSLYILPSLVIYIMLMSACENKSENEATDDHEHETEMDDHEHSQASSGEISKPASPRKAAMEIVYGNHVHIDYSSPSVRSRVIFGGLVAFDQVWVTGAHKATSIDFQHAVKIAGQEIEAGKYAFFTIPGRDKWTVIINKNYDQHLADDYDPELDVVRFDIKAEILDDVQESLEYSVESLGDMRGRISIAWGKIKVSFEFENI